MEMIRVAKKGFRRQNPEVDDKVAFQPEIPGSSAPRDTPTAYAVTTPSARSP